MECSLHINEGDEVEVTSQEEGFIGSWYIGTIIRPSERTKKKSFLVEYHTLKEEKNGLTPLRDFVPGSDIRPRPPSEITPFFQLNDEVDAYYNDGWWQGVIIKVLDGCRYAVYFSPTKEEMEFGKSELRSHLEWVDGTWVRSQDRIEEKKQAAADVLYQYSQFVMVCIGERVRPCDLRLHLMKEISGMPTSLKRGPSVRGRSPDAVGEPSSSSAMIEDKGDNSQAL